MVYKAKLSQNSPNPRRTVEPYKCPLTGTDAIYFSEMYLGGVDKSTPAPEEGTELGIPPYKSHLVIIISLLAEVPIHGPR